MVYECFIDAKILCLGCFAPQRKKKNQFNLAEVWAFHVGSQKIPLQGAFLWLCILNLTVILNMLGKRESSKGEGVGDLFRAQEKGPLDSIRPSTPAPTFRVLSFHIGMAFPVNEFSALPSIPFPVPAFT